MADLNKLKPYFHRKGARQRIILYLLASGFSAEDLIHLTSIQLAMIEIPIKLEVYREEMLATGLSGLAFQYRNGRPFNCFDIYNLLRTTTKKVTGFEMSLSDFREQAK